MSVKKFLKISGNRSFFFREPCLQGLALAAHRYYLLSCEYVTITRKIDLKMVHLLKGRKQHSRLLQIVIFIGRGAKRRDHSILVQFLYL